MKYREKPLQHSSNPNRRVEFIEKFQLYRNEWEGTDEPFLLPPNQIRQIVDGTTANQNTPNQPSGQSAPLPTGANQTTPFLTKPHQPKSEIGLEDLEKFPDLTIQTTFFSLALSPPLFLIRYNIKLEFISSRDSFNSLVILF